jgi:hypothetical protein
MKDTLLWRVLMRCVLVASSRLPAQRLSNLLAVSDLWADQEAFLQEVLYQYFSAYGPRHQPRTLSFLAETAEYTYRRLMRREKERSTSISQLMPAAWLALAAKDELVARDFLMEYAGRILLTAHGRDYVGLNFPVT